MRLRLTILFFLCGLLPSLAARVDTLEVQSPSMDKTLKNVVILPESYRDTGTGYPVVYLLHGAGDLFDKWVKTVPAIKELADRHELIIVCPDGGVTSWYLDSPIDPAMHYETYISGELVPVVDRNYNTIPHAHSRAITGHSMGGHGAMYLAIRHPDLFGAAGSMSGGLDFTGFPHDWDIAKRLGPYAENQELWRSNTVLSQSDRLKGSQLRILLDCGTEDFFFEVNQRMHQKLTALKIPHEYTVRPGGHEWPYWANAIKYQLLFFEGFFGERENK